MNKHKKVVELEKVVIKFAGDSGDGMQLTGTQFSDTSALLGNDIATFPDYPAEIRAPQGTVAGVSGFQVHVGKIDIFTPGDQADVLVAMNPAALKANMNWIKPAATIIVDTDSFDKKNLERAGYATNPLRDSSLAGYKIIEAPITSLTRDCISYLGLDSKTVIRSKNMFALGMVYFMFTRSLTQTEKFFSVKFKKNPVLIEANTKVLHTGYYYAETLELLSPSYSVLPAKLQKGTYRNITGNQAVAWGFLAAAEKANRELFLGSYPITPASDILHELAKQKQLGAKIFQAEDEIAGICSTIGASFAGDFAITTTSGPGLALKGEAIGLAVMAELPIVIVDVQRGGPSTGLPTKTEQSDLMQALYGRNGESPTVLIAASTPANCFDFAFKASKIAMEYMSPVILLTDGFLANGTEPWRIVDSQSLPSIHPPLITENDGSWYPYVRNEETLARFWAIPGTPGLEHRIGGLEKQEVTGNVSYDSVNHERMCKLRAEKIQKVIKDIPKQTVDGVQSGDLLVVGWGGTYGHLYTSVMQMFSEGKSIGLAHFNYINPLPENTEEIFGRFKKIIVCELNLGQFVNHLRAKITCRNYLQYNKVQGLPFTVEELTNEFKKLLS